MPLHIVAFLLAFATLPNCALTDARVTGPHVPSRPARAVAPLPIVLAAIEYRAPVTKPAAVGVKKNGYGMETADVYLAPSPSRWVQHALRSELSHERIVPVLATGIEPVVHFVVEQLFVEPAISLWGADMTARTAVVVQVYWPAANRMFERRFVGNAKNFHLLWTDDTFETALRQSAQAAFGEATQELRAMLEGRAL